MNMSKEELASILSELDADLKKSAAEAEAILKKADGEAPPEKEDASSPAEDVSAPPESPAPDASAAPAGPPDASAGAPPMGPPDGSAPVDPAAAAPQGEAPLTPEALQAEYAQLSPEELDMHLQAALAAKEALAAAAGPAAGAPPDASAGAPPDASAGAPPMAPPAGPPMMGKEELKINAENTGGKISKSELDTLKALVKSQQEDIENLAKATRTILETPIRKSVTSLIDVQPLSKTEVTSMKRRDVDNFIKENAHKMTKSERDLWIDFVDNKVPAAKLAPMLDRLTSK